MNVSQRGRAALAGVAAAALFGALAAIGLAAGARLSANAAAAPVPAALAPARTAVLSAAPPRPDSRRTVLRINGDRLIVAAYRHEHQHGQQPRHPVPERAATPGGISGTAGWRHWPAEPAADVRDLVKGPFRGLRRPCPRCRAPD